MAVQVCGHCGNESHFTPTGSPNIPDDLAIEQPGYCEQSLNCDSCGRMSVFYVLQGHRPRWHVTYNKMPEFWNSHDPDEWSPRWVAGQSFDDVPDHIGDAASEAHRIFSIGAIRSAVLMSRAVIEASCKDKNITSWNFGKKD